MTNTDDVSVSCSNPGPSENTISGDVVAFDLLDAIRGTGYIEFQMVANAAPNTYSQSADMTSNEFSPQSDSGDITVTASTSCQSYLIWKNDTGNLGGNTMFYQGFDYLSDTVTAPTASANNMGWSFDVTRAIAYDAKRGYLIWKNDISNPASNTMFYQKFDIINDVTLSPVRSANNMD